MPSKAHLDYGCKLLQVANHQELRAAKGLAVVAVTAHHGVHSIEQISTHHAYLVNHEKVERAYDVFLYLAESEVFAVAPIECCARKVRRKRKLEERVYRHSACVYGGYARRSEHHHALLGLLFQVFQECGLARAGLAGKKQVGAGTLHYLPSQLKFKVIHASHALVSNTFHALKRLAVLAFFLVFKHTQVRGVTALGYVMLLDGLAYGASGLVRMRAVTEAAIF